MPSSPGSFNRGHNNKGATPEAVAEWAENNYAELRRRRDRYAGAHNATPLDPLADELRRRARRK
jgi:hypothetical protein